ncbi:MAG: metalloendopeptidase [Sphingomonadales bacterium]|nr:MAG: metalloendopeptidase [Sphingomonadales bacterium]
MLATGSFAAAQIPSVTEQQSRLRDANAQSKAAQARSRALEAAAAGERDQAAQARAQEQAAAERIKAAEADIAAATARIGIVDRQLADQRIRVAEQQGPILRLIAALQSMARRPPVLGLVQPGSTEDIVHVRAVLGTAMPVVEARTADVRAELNRIRALRGEAAAAVASLSEARNRIESERIALVKLEGAHRARSRELDKGALVESDRALALGERARDLVDQMESAGDAAELQGDLVGLPGPLPRTGDPAAPKRSAGGPPYRLPVTGQVVTGMGELSSTGVRARGITIACAPEMQAVAPAMGKIIYAAPFRAYGGVVIVDHGNGWTSLVTGLGAVAVKVGDQVAQGSVIGRAPGGEYPRVTVELRRRGQPMDLAQLLD